MLYFLHSHFFINYSCPSEFFILSLHDALPISYFGGEDFELLGTVARKNWDQVKVIAKQTNTSVTEIGRSEEHTSELQSRGHLVCRLLLEKKKIKKAYIHPSHSH